MRLDSEMNLRKTAPPEASTSTVSTEAGRQLDDARATDRRWRADLALRLHRRLGKLRKSDVLVQRWGASISGYLMLAVLAVLFGIW